jgi:hypothetical protein
LLVEHHILSMVIIGCIASHQSNKHDFIITAYQIMDSSHGFFGAGTDSLALFGLMRLPVI